MATDVARRLASWFAEPDIGVVCGRLVLTDPRTGRNVDGLYWKYETFLKKCESRLGALLGSNGAIYAIRKELFPIVPPGTLIDDFVIPLQAKRNSGCRIVYDKAAIAKEETAPTIRAEFRRRVRIGAGGFQSIGMLWPLLSPANGWVALTFFCHKILRWVCPFLLVGMLATSVLLIREPLYAWLFAAQVGFYTVSVVGHWLPAGPSYVRYLRLPAMFSSMNLALFFGFVRWLRGGHTGVWTRTDRAVEEEASGSNPDLLRPIGAE
jgi:cellulose synthase/poly-beta-1,6-N-acetylglucosamine synthase-like glycosyltransferase